jgi:hypothetical protein
MTEPFTKVHRETLQELAQDFAKGWMSLRFTVALAAALAEIDRLRAELARLESIRKAEYGS